MREPHQFWGRRKRGGNRVTIPERAGPHVKLLFAEMARQGVTYDALEERSGVRRAALKAWRHKNSPNWTSLAAVFNSIGWDLVPVPRSGTLPPELETGLLALAEKFDRSMPEVFWRLLFLIAAQQTPTAGVLPASRWEA
jgi:hypothetical protein